MEYLILEAESAKDLEVRVYKAIQKGWRPQGGVSVSAAGWFVQAVIRVPPNVKLTGCADSEGVTKK